MVRQIAAHSGGQPEHAGFAGADLLTACLETIDTPTLLLDPGGSVAYLTTGAASLLGIEKASVLRHPWPELWAQASNGDAPLDDEAQRRTLYHGEKRVAVRAWQRALPGTGLTLVGLEDLSDEDQREREVVRILWDLQEQSDDLFALYQITQLLNNAQDLDQLCNHFLRELERITAADISCLYLATARGGLQPKVWHGLDETPTPREHSGEALQWLQARVPDHRILALQLHAEERLVGLALLAHHKELGRRQRFLQTVAKEMGTALFAMEGRQALLAQEQKLEAIVESTTDAIIQVDRNLRVRGFNPAAVLLTGFSAQEALSHSCAEVLGCSPGSKGSGCKGSCPFASVLANHEPIPFSEIVVSASTGPRYMAASVAALDLSTRSGSAAVGILRDISRIKQVEQMKDDFFATVSHQLRTPLALLRGYLDTLQHLKLSPSEQRACIEGIADTTARLEHLVQQVLDVTRIEDGRLDLHLEPVRLVDVLRGALAALPANAHRSRIWADLAPDLPSLNADPGRLEEALINLLDNALKYSPPTGQVVVRASETASHKGVRQVMVQIMDEGIGIPLEDLESVFTKFHRATNARSLQIPGTGLGLFICRSIIEAHGGRIMLSSGPSTGTCVTFWMPVAAREV